MYTAEDVPFSDPSFQPLESAEGASPTVPQPRFTIIKLLGRGSQGSVYLAKDSRRNDELVAIKYILRDVPSESQVKYMAREVLNHQELSLFQHPHIVQLYEVFLTSRYLAMVLEHIDGVDLFTYLTSNGGSLAENNARSIFQQLILAVDFCHRIGKGHRDIKLGNILVQMKGQTAPLIKLCDFGFSKDHFDSSPKTPVGTAFFLAPEVIMSDHSNSYAVEASDTWACGIVLFSSLFSGHPYLLKEHLESKRCPFILKMVQNCKEGKIFFPSWAEQLIPSAVGLLSRILEPDPKIRMTIPEIIQHPWFQENLEPGIIARNSTMEATKDPLQTFETIQGIIMQACRKKEGNLQPSNASILNSVMEEMKLRAKTG